MGGAAKRLTFNPTLSRSASGAPPHSARASGVRFVSCPKRWAEPDEVPRGSLQPVGVTV